MFFELVGTLLAGVAAGLLVWVLNRTLKGRLPAWLVPVSAGGAMLLATISSEYGWFARTKATLPEGVVVAQTVEEASPYRPWTYLHPFTSRFVAVDQATIRTHPRVPDQRIVDLFFYGRWAPTAKVPVLFDCAAGRRAEIGSGVQFGEDGEVTGVNWRDVPEGEPVTQAACAEA
ncbi:hypothetical protein [Jannaschia aquimarina]|uniref:Uncharacterized protein n=1 Tax=Jannaschia aquimarina TaxID=935700 RepID=A0A0D1ECT7_9RHOB|nr:hypothetical protein [Jannaschia aquimarina]KIT14746.1 hypothetical protein jaqu_35500 [Jannaschia aquimarina]SNS76368.1 hypothetical protein SAMN05421775_102195 [Jannaschia aquimarina]